MKAIKSLLLFSVMLLFIGSRLQGQSGRIGMDSVSIMKLKRNQDIYRYFDNGDREVKYQKKPLKGIISNKAGKIARDTGNGLLTAISGLGFDSSTDVRWEVGGVVTGSDSLPDWEIRLFCDGREDKSRNRVRNDDGSTSVETVKTNVMYWDKDASGSIMEGNDTIGIFLILMNPASDTLLKDWSADMFAQPQAIIKTSSKKSLFSRPINFPEISYGIVGVLRDNNFAIISNGSALKSWIILGNNKKSVFQPDIDNIIGKKDERVQPYLLINSDISYRERRDLYRLAVTSRFLNNSLKL